METMAAWIYAGQRTCATVGIVTEYERAEWSRCAKAMYARGQNGLGHMLSAAASKSVLPTYQFDMAANTYRAWLVFDKAQS